jgi:hypothetical protein
VDDTFRAIADQGLAIVAVVFLAVALWWVIRAYIQSLRDDLDACRRVRDEAIAGWRAQTAATEKLTDRVSEFERQFAQHTAEMARRSRSR